MKHGLAVSLVALLLTGCGGLSSVPLPAGAAYSDDGQYLPPQPGPGLVANPDSLIPDVPVPIGFKPLVDRSWNRSLANVRRLKYWYQGQAQEAEVQLFYHRQLAAHGWQFVDRYDDADGSLVLRYTKGAEALRVRLAQIHAITTVVINIEPKEPTAQSLP